MGVTIASTRFAARTTNGDQDITTTDLGGLTPKAVLFSWSYATADNTATNGLVRGHGVSDASVEMSVNMTDRHGQATSSTATFFDQNRCISLRDDAGTLLAYADVSAFITNGVTITWTVTTGTAILIDAVFFAGSDLSVDVHSQILTNAVDSAHDITAPGFEPDVLLNFSATANGFGLGVVHNNRAGTVTQQSAVLRYRTGRNTMENYSIFRDNYGCGISNGAFAADGNCWLEFGSFDSSGYTATTRLVAPGAGTAFFCLALRFGSSPVVDSKVYTFTTPTATGNNTDSTPGFTPQFVLYHATMMEASATYYSDGNAGATALIEITNNFQDCVAWASEDNAADSNTQSLIDDVAVNFPIHTGAAGLAATFSSFGATGVTLNWSDVETNGKKFIALAIESDSVAAATSLPFPRRNKSIQSLLTR